MSDEIKALLVVIGTFLFSMLSYLVNFWEDGSKLEKKHTAYLFRAGVFGAGLGLITFFGSDLMISYWLKETIEIHTMVKVGITSIIAGLSPWLFTTITKLIKKKGE